MDNDNKKEEIRQQQSRARIRNTIFCLLALVCLIAILWVVYSQPKGKEAGYQFFEEQVVKGNVEKVEFNNSRISFETKDGKWYWFYNRSSFENRAGDLVSDYNNGVLQWNETNPDNALTLIQVTPGTSSTFNFFNILYPILLLVGIVLMIYFISRQIRGINSRNMEFTKNRARIAVSKVRFDKVAGADEEKEELEEIIQFLKDPEKFTKIGARIPKGVLLIGPPGTGKTLLAKAVAGEANVPFFTISGSDFMELYVGVGASRVRDLFENAKRAKPCIVFIDEIDAVGRQRGTGLGGGNDEREQTLNQLLVQMDGFETNEGIIVMAATNRADILDPALTRPGRFDRQIYINIPDVKGREEILKVHSAGKPLNKDVKLKEIARVTSGFTGADLENVLNEAAILAARRNRSTISMEDINNAIVKVSIGPQKKSRVVSEKDKRMTAFHESGHAIVEKCVKNSNPVHEVSIIQRGGAAGYTISRPDNDDNHYTKQKLLDMIIELLAGRGSEELFLDDITAGASNDISRATQLARRMVTEFGMSDTLGLVSHGEESEVFLGRDYQTRATYSEVEASKIDAAVKKIIDDCYSETKSILKAHKKEVETMVEVLLEKETIYADEVDMIMEGKSKDEVVAYIESKQKAKKDEDDKLKKEQEEAKNTESAGDYIENLLKEVEKRANAKNQAQSEKKPEENKDVTHETIDDGAKNKEKETKANEPVKQTEQKDAKTTKQSTSKDEKEPSKQDKPTPKPKSTTKKEDK